MSKAILEFNLDDIDDNEKFQKCVNAEKMYSALWELVHNSKKKIIRKSEMSDKDIIELCFEEIYELTKEINLEL